MIRTFILSLALLFAAPAVAQEFPKFTGFVVDDANVLPPAEEAALAAKLDALQQDTKRQFVVATIGDMQGYPLEEYGYRLSRAWGVGLKNANNGAILFVAPNNPPGQRGPRIEVGYGLEPILTDAFSSVMINREMMPRLKGGDVPGAITAGADAIVAQLRASPEEAQAQVDAAIVEFDRTHRRQASARQGGFPVGLIFWGVILLFFVLPLFARGSRRRGPWGGRRYGGSNLPIILWGLPMRQDGARAIRAEVLAASEADRRAAVVGEVAAFRAAAAARLAAAAHRGMVMLQLSDADHALVTEAVTQAERSSDGEIVTIVTARSDAYHDVGLHYAVLAMLLVPATLAALPQSCVDRAMGLFLGWNATLTRSALMLFLFAALALAFLIVRFALAYMPLRMALTPKATKSRRVRRRAVELFRVGAERRTHGRTGVLLYLSLAEHRAEIVADEAIHSKVDQEVWGDAMAALIGHVKAGRPGEGMALAVEKIGLVLAQCLPRSSEDTNELPDRLIEL